MKELNITSIKKNSYYLEDIVEKADCITFANMYRTVLELSDKSIRSYMMLYNVVRSTEYAYKKYITSKDPDIMKLERVKKRLDLIDDEQVRGYLINQIIVDSDDYEQMIRTFEEMFDGFLRSITDLETLYDALMLLYEGRIEISVHASQLMRISAEHRIELRMHKLLEGLSHQEHLKVLEFEPDNMHIEELEGYCIVLESWQEICDGLLDYVEAVLKLV